MSKDSTRFRPALARPLVWSDPHNRIIAVLALASFPFAFAWKYFFNDADLTEALWISAGAPVTVFLTWAIGRECDPIRPWSALLAGFASLVAWIILANPDFVLLFVALMCFRLVGRSTGKKSTLPESALVLFLTAWLTWSGSVYAGAVVGLAFWLDARLPDRRLSHYFFALMALITGVAASLTTVDVIIYLDELQLYFIAVSVLLVIPTIIFYQKQEVVADNGIPVSLSRIMAVIGLSWLFLSCGAITLTNVGLQATYPFFIVLLSMGILNTVSKRKVKS